MGEIEGVGACTEAGAGPTIRRPGKQEVPEWFGAIRDFLGGGGFVLVFCLKQAICKICFGQQTTNCPYYVVNRHILWLAARGWLSNARGWISYAARTLDIEWGRPEGKVKWQYVRQSKYTVQVTVCLWIKAAASQAQRFSPRTRLDFMCKRKNKQLLKLCRVWKGKEFSLCLRPEVGKGQIPNNIFFLSFFLFLVWCGREKNVVESWRLFGSVSGIECMVVGVVTQAVFFFCFLFLDSHTLTNDTVENPVII